MYGTTGKRVTEGGEKLLKKYEYGVMPTPSPECFEK